MNPFLLGLALCSSAWSQVQLSPTVVTASALEEDADLASQRVRVVTRAEMESLGAANVQEVITRLPGIHLLVHPATPTFAQVSMQGLGGSAIKVLIDGVEVAGDVGGITPLDLIPVGDVERIEIVEGASSVLYGSDALGGVVNVITRSARPSGEVMQRAASNESVDGSFRNTWKHGQAMYRLSSAYLWDNGSTRLAETPFGESIDLYPVPPRTAQQARLASDWKFNRSRVGYSTSFRRNTQVVRDATKIESAYEDMAIEATISGKTPATTRSDVEGEISLQNFDHRIKQWNLEWNHDLGSQQSSFQEGQANLRWVWRKDSWNTILIGTFANLEALSSEDFPEKRRSASLDVYAQDMISWKGEDQLLIVPGIRYSSQLPMEDGQYDGVVTPKLSMRYAPHTNLVFRSAYGMGYRRPSMKQKYWVLFHQAPYNFLLRGNPDLKPERSHSLNFSVEHRVAQAFYWSANVFGNYLFDLIEDRVVDPEEGVAVDNEGTEQPYVHVRSYANTSKALTAGGSLELGSYYGNCHSRVSYSYLIAKTNTSGLYEDMTLQVPHSIRIQQSYHFRTRTSLHLQAQWNDRQLVSIAPKRYSPDFVQFDYSLWQDLGKNWQVFAGVDNILDNWHPQKGNANLVAHDQEHYYGLFDGRKYHAGTKFHF